MKKINLRKKKAFTLVELIVVIAILAILATVSVVGYVSFIKKANVSNDISLTTQLNEALQADWVTKQPATMTEANETIKNMGYNLSLISPTTDGYSYIWNSETNRVILLDENKKVVAPEGATFDPTKAFAIVHNKDDITNWSGYSLYLADDFTPAAENGTLNVSTGIDVGECTSVTTINYTNTDSAKNVVIRTNGGTLTVNAPRDTVHHYGAATIVTVTEVANASYHEHGEVDEIKLAKGRVVIENKGTVGSVMVTATVATDIKVENNGSLGGVAAKEAAVAGALADKVTGVDENKVLTEFVDNSDFAGGLGTEEAPFLIGNVGQWKAFAVEEYSTRNYSWKVISDLDFSSTSDIYVNRFIGNIDFDNNIIEGVSEQNAYNGYLFRYAGNSSSSVKISNLQFNIKGKSSLVYQDNAKNLTMQNITVNGYCEIAGDNNYSPFISRIWSTETNKATVIMRNCINNANITNNGCTGVFVGKVYEEQGDYSANITFDHCVNNGTIIRTAADKYASMFFSNACTFRHQKIEDIKIINCENNGYIAGTKGARIIAENWGGSWNEEKETTFIQSLGSDFKQTSANVGTITTGNLIVADDGYFVLPEEPNAARYTFSFGMWNTVYADSSKEEMVSWGASSLTFAFTSSQLSEAKISAKQFEQYDYTNGTNYTETTLFGVKYYTNSNGNYVYSINLSKWNDGACAEIGLQPTVSFVAYNENGTPIAFYTFNLNTLN